MDNIERVIAIKERYKNYKFSIDTNLLKDDLRFLKAEEDKLFAEILRDPKNETKRDHVYFKTVTDLYANLVIKELHYRTGFDERVLIGVFAVIVVLWVFYTS